MKYLSIAFAVVVMSMAMSVSLQAKEKTYSIQVQNGSLREKASYLSKVLHRLPYATQVAIKSEKGSWVEVINADKSKQGWIHRTALSKPGIKLEAIAAADQAKAMAKVSGKEVANAGKGFEKKIKNKSKDGLDYRGVDQMESRGIGEEKKVEYLTELQKKVQGGEK